MKLFSKNWFSMALHVSLDYINWIHPNQYHVGQWISYYQDKCRFYLDDYPEQEELRKEYFARNPISYIQYSINCTDVLEKLDSLLQLADDYCYFESDQIFANRWMKRS